MYLNTLREGVYFFLYFFILNYHIRFIYIYLLIYTHKLIRKELKIIYTGFILTAIYLHIFFYNGFNACLRSISPFG